MWKHTCQCLILLTLASLPCAHPTQAAMMVKDAEEQIHLITDARDIWDLRARYGHSRLYVQRS